MWSLSILSGLSHCDLIVDTAAPERAHVAAEAVKAGCGLDVDFSGLRAVNVQSPLSLGVKEVEGSIRAMLPSAAIAQVCEPSAIRRGLRQLSCAKADKVFPLIERVSAARTTRVSKSRSGSVPIFA
jgi:hypothetical protein